MFYSCRGICSTISYLAVGEVRNSNAQQVSHCSKCFHLIWLILTVKCPGQLTWYSLPSNSVLSFFSLTWRPSVLWCEVLPPFFFQTGREIHNYTPTHSILWYPYCTYTITEQQIFLAKGQFKATETGTRRLVQFGFIMMINMRITAPRASGRGEAIHLSENGCLCVSVCCLWVGEGVWLTEGRGLSGLETERSRLIITSLQS